ncbi:MAG: hypothetical protein A3B10_02775 [Candidatus Doudnabacteria bacterium RIFCSPLOWO2_01_FULL_44_21]|uniref:Zinc-ribbon domain-containing protein n=1 Tax=Candidatus Doudnabacteria bacterium RIFCSPLOWO2_01_FULL_44_21 TaxID=1817841 RepID=A0A1F5Q1Z8_9BACT|nr:MAG: hypothetical protein A3B95_03045 [Candidatus Doudnabacteria bacterium RIFCSPHIGHO2_02_FULL_43_13b]OGE96211.1 MAG: hypothetical protein A3B10_02775 [Candidatus Doudnabacteria bacterium RIFCSPLOWO2_01_FULL_44_21]
MVCPNCSTPVPTGEQFCPGCGTELTSADPTNTPTPTTDASASSQPALATLTYGATNIPLREGSKVIIAREGTDKCTPDLAINSDGVSSTPVEVSVENGVITVRDTGTSVGIRVVKYIKPGGSMTVEPGDMVMLGNEIIAVG